eukprot:6975304-Prymnesium_polylepis.1
MIAKSAWKRSSAFTTDSDWPWPVGSRSASKIVTLLPPCAAVIATDTRPPKSRSRQKLFERRSFTHTLPMKYSIRQGESHAK